MTLWHTICISCVTIAAALAWHLDMAWVPIGISILGLLIACWAARSALRSARAAEESLRNSVRPVLVLVKRSPHSDPTGQKLWHLINVGNGCAKDIVLGDYVEGQEGKSWRVTRLYPLPRGESMVVRQGIEAGVQIAATYCDIDGRAFTTECSENRNAISNGNRHSDWSPAEQELNWPRESP